MAVDARRPHHAEASAAAAGAAVAIPVAAYLVCLWFLHDRPEYRQTRAYGPIAAILVLLTPFTGQAVLLTGVILAVLVGLKLVVRQRAFGRFIRARSKATLRATERFTRVRPDTLNHEVTVTDPTTWARPWTAMIPLKSTSDAIYEYACHEGNHSLTGILKGHRTVERAASSSSSGSR